MKLTAEKKEIYARAMEILLSEIQERIEDKATEMHNSGEYWEFDGDDGRPEHCPRMTYDECVESVCDDMQYQSDDYGMYNFMEFAIGEIYGEPMSKTNNYHNAYLPDDFPLPPLEKSLSCHCEEQSDVAISHNK